MRVVVFDRTCLTGRRGLSPAWAVGVRLYREWGWIDDACGVASWSEALAWLARRPQPIREIQYWGHGTWGGALIDRERLDESALLRRRSEVAGVRSRLAPDALVWFRTCHTLGARAGQRFAIHVADALGARVAGHTYVIGYHQSGLHGLPPGGQPDWSPDEGLAEGTAEDPVRARWSRAWAPRTVTAMTSRIPLAWFSGARLQ